MHVVIYGAGSIALGLCEALNILYPEYKPEYFVVTDIEGNPSTLYGLSVVQFEKFDSIYADEKKSEVEFLIATPESVMGEIGDSIRHKGYENVIGVTAEIWGKLMTERFKREPLTDNLGIVKPLQFIETDIVRAQEGISQYDINKTVHVYMAKHHKDRKLKNHYDMQPWVRCIQVGSYGTDECISDKRDDEGDNISRKNVNYSELTALYRLWKESIKDTDLLYAGIAHYRRILHIEEYDIWKMIENDVDAVLAYPMPYEPDIGAHHKKYLKDSDWEAALMAVKIVSPDIYGKMKEIFEGRYFYNYNLSLMKKSVLNDYCRWLFAVLEKVEVLSVPMACDRADRYIGYIAESLTTLYFAANKDKLKIVHTWCDFYV